MQKLSTAMVRQLRAIRRLPAHISHTTNAQVCQQAFPCRTSSYLISSARRASVLRPPLQTSWPVTHPPIGGSIFNTVLCLGLRSVSSG